MRVSRLLCVLHGILMILILAACSAPAGETAAQATLAPTQAAGLPSVTNTSQPEDTATPAPTATVSFTFTPSATVTSIPTATELPTVTPSPAPLTVTPGEYGVGLCQTQRTLSNGLNLGDYQFCVQSVYVNKKREIIVYVTWTLHKAYLGKVYKLSDINNGSMYISDNFGRTYGHIGGGGDSYENVLVQDGVPMSGWFKFPALQEGAYAITFHEGDSGFEMGPLSLLVPSVNYVDLALIHTPYILTARDDFWKTETQADGTSLVSHIEIPGCTVQEKAYTEPQGKLKSKIEIGNITYEIYGYLLSDQNLGVREYLVVGGLEGVSENVKPYFVVNIPLDHNDRCIMDVSNLMAKLSKHGAE